MGVRGISAQTLAGAGYVETKATETNTWKIFGLSAADTDAGYTSINYAVGLGPDDQIYIFENGVFRGTVGTYATGDTFRVERSADGHVVYKRNGAVFYASSVLSSGTLRADTSLYTQYASVAGTTLSSNGGPATPVTWINQVGVIEGGALGQRMTTSLGDVNGDGRMDVVQMASDGRLWVREGQADGTLGATIALGAGIDGLNDLHKTAGTVGWDSGASSSQSLAGAGYVETVLSETTTGRMLGLSSVDSNASYFSIDYGVVVRGDDLLDVYESGAYRGTFTTYAPGDTLRIERLANGQVVYKKNGTVFYTSTIVSTAELHVDTSFYSPGATLEDVVLSVNGGAAKAVQWENETGIAVGNLGVTITTTLGDINGDGRADAVQTMVDGRLWLRLGQADGSFGDAVAYGTGIDGLNNLYKVSGVTAWESGASSSQSFTGAVTPRRWWQKPTPTGCSASPMRIRMRAPLHSTMRSLYEPTACSTSMSTASTAENSRLMRR